MEKEFAIFDMDGTLVDSMPKWRRLIREYLEDHGLTEIPEDFINRMKHRHIRENAADLIRQFHLSGDPDSVMEELNGIMEVFYRTEVEAKDGVRDYLERLQRRGVHMAVASATASHLIEICLRRLGLRDFFEAVVSCNDVGIGKQQPDVYDACIRSMGGRREQTAVYEDALFAVQTAHRAGYYTVGVYDAVGAQQWEELSETADEVIEHWTQA